MNKLRMAMGRPESIAGRTEEILGKWLEDKRERFVVATKCRFRVGHGPNDEGLSRKHILKAAEDSLRRLRTDYIDLYQAHAPDPDTPPAEIPGFVHVNGRRGDLPTFTGIQRQPDEDLRLISSLGYINLPAETPTRVPLLLNYRGEVIPAFALQAFLTWARISMSEVQIEVGSHIALPDGRKIPINWDGTVTVNPNVAKLGRRFTLNELLLLAQQRQKKSELGHDVFQGL